MIFKLKILFVVFEWYFIQNFRIRKRLPDFSWYNIPKRGNSYRMSKNISKCCKIDQMSIKVTNIFIARPSRIYPNCDPENIPSGNPVRKRSENFSAEMVGVPVAEVPSRGRLLGFEDERVDLLHEVVVVQTALQRVPVGNLTAVFLKRVFSPSPRYICSKCWPQGIHIAPRLKVSA
jgi:hypothetical protein